MPCNQELTEPFDPNWPQFEIAPICPSVPRQIPGRILATDTRHKGEEAQLRIQLHAAQRGFWVSKPTMEGCRYDLVIDDGSRLYRVQCKYCGIERNGMVRVGLEKFTGGIKGYAARTYSDTEIDAIVVYVAAVDRLLWLPPDVWAGKHAVQLRLTPAANGQKKGILLVRDYLWM